jgi:hypothetical protein
MMEVDSGVDVGPQVRRLGLRVSTQSTRNDMSKV